MSGLDIAALRLTKDELMDALSPYPETIAFHQLAKALSGIVRQIQSSSEDIDDVATWIAEAQALEQANIKRPAVPS